jgi:hypothetical protein
LGVERDANTRLKSAPLNPASLPVLILSTLVSPLKRGESQKRTFLRLKGQVTEDIYEIRLKDTVLLQVTDLAARILVPSTTALVWLERGKHSFRVFALLAPQHAGRHNLEAIFVMSSGGGYKNYQ